MKLLWVLLAAMALTVSCGGAEEPEPLAEPEETVETEPAPEPVTVEVSRGFGVYRELLWVEYSLSSSNEWDHHVQPGAEGEPISFQVEPGETWDIRCLDSDLNHYYKWEVEIGEEGFLWEVDSRDPDNLFSNYTHQTFDTKDVCEITVVADLGAGVINSLVIRETTVDGVTEVEHLEGRFIQPENMFTFRVRKGMTFDLLGSNTFGEAFIIPNFTAEGDEYRLNLGN